MSVLFSDIRSFTTLSETMTPEENFYFLNDYLKLIGPCITRYEGFIDKFIGDGIMALFPGHCVSIADDALSSALCMLEKLKEFNEYRRHLKKPAVSVGIGIHTGPLTLGTIGFASRIETTVIGDTVNLASRIESLTKHYGITIGITSTTLQALKMKDSLLIREIDTVQVKGKEEAITVYEIFNADSESVKATKLKTLERYSSAIACYKQGRWDDALCLFHELESQMDNDRVINIYLQRCYVFKANPPGSEWVGVTRLDEK
jgi:class 3 adenylate cyclase